jgi:hypothetical protein
MIGDSLVKTLFLFIFFSWQLYAESTTGSIISTQQESYDIPTLSKKEEKKVAKEDKKVEAPSASSRLNRTNDE